MVSWEPETDQWWITGFNPSTVGEANVKKQVMIGSVDFGDNKEMYSSFKHHINQSERLSTFAKYDDVNCIIWILWCEEELII